MNGIGETELDDPTRQICQPISKEQNESSVRLHWNHKSVIKEMRNCNVRYVDRSR